MMRYGRGILRAVALLVGCACGLFGGFEAIHAVGMGALTVTVSGIKPGGVIPGSFAYCVPAKQGHVSFGPNKSPAIRWSKGPADTASYAIVMVDPDAPTVLDTANREGQIIPADLARGDFYHWILVDIPSTVTGLPAGAESTGHDAKPVGPTKHGLRGANSVGDFGGRTTKGPTGGYDGPCPPWNDVIPHHYRFGVYALNIRSLGLSGPFTAPDALRAMKGHVLATGEVVGIYTQNPDVAKTLGIKF
jgi:Raf kinase inhibitor-like YbhB/YbcL family protein